jgi:hypothetical protein
MPVHVHTMRSAFAATLGLITAAILLGWAYQPPPGELELVTVTGRATCGGRPLDGMLLSSRRSTWAASSPSARSGTTARSGWSPGANLVAMA